MDRIQKNQEPSQSLYHGSHGSIMARKKVHRHSHNPQISTLNFKVSAMIMHLPTSLKTMCSLIESKSVNAILGT